MLEFRDKNRENLGVEKVLPTGEDLGGASNLIGLVLCGGESKRMGNDKGLLFRNNVPWSVILSNQIEKLNIQAYVSINPSQVNSYQAYFQEDLLVIDSEKSQGPLTGLLSTHHTFPDKDILLVACDMIEITQETLVNLVTEYSTNSTFDFFAFNNAGIIEPLCAIYTAKALSIITRDIERDEKYSGSLKRILNTGNTKVINPIGNSSFRNYNRQSDLKS